MTTSNRTRRRRFCFSRCACPLGLLRGAVLGALTLMGAASPVSALSRLEIYGDFTGAGTLEASITGISWGAPNLEWILGTYSHSGGNVPEGGHIPGGGIDPVLSVYQSGSLLATSNNLSATNFDAEIRTPNVNSRPGAVVLPPQVWASGYTVGVGPASAGTLGNGQFSLVSYLPGDSLQLLDDVVVPASAWLRGIYAHSTRVSTPTGHGFTLSDRLWLSTGSHLYIEDANLNSKNVDIIQSSISVLGAGTLTADTLDVGDSAADRSVITLNGTGGINTQAAYFATASPDAAVTVNHHSGNFTTRSMMIDRPESGGATSHYNLYGGALTVNSLSLGDAVLHVSGGTLNVPFISTLSGGSLGEKITWDSGTIAITESTDAVVSTNSFFGSRVSLTPGRTLSLNAPGLTSFVSLVGGKLAIRELANAGLAMDWQSGELHLTGTSGATIGLGKPLGDQLAIRQGMTLRVGAALTTETFSRLVLNDGAMVYANNMTNGGEIALQSTGASLNIAGTLTNNGVLRGSGRVSGTVQNQQNARIEIDSDDSFRLVGNLTNAGQIRLTGGDLLLTGFSLVNQSTGKITGRGVIGAGGIDNRGTITLSAGVSDIDAPLLTNRANAKTIVTGGGNATFYGTVVNETGAEFRISADSRATFLGTVTNLAAFTGTGAKVFDGSASGASLMTGGSTEVEPGGSLTVGGIRERSLTLRGSVVIGSNGVVSRVNTLAMEGGTLDLCNNTLVIDYTGASPIASVRAAVRASDVFSSVVDPRTGIAVAEAADLDRTSAGDIPLDSTALLVAFALKGDADVSGSVNFDDLLVLAQHYGDTTRTWVSGDFTNDGMVGFDDLLALAQNYNGTLLQDGAAALPASREPAFSADFALAVSLVPEPTGVLWLSAASMLARSRRR